ncbi:MAG TPA: DUF411 domain-containing protein [Gemmatimonadaceae bacterium]|nr:DUF411 domain-containing protein [Gemmatimonadaceae bacterium]
MKYRGLFRVASVAALATLMSASAPGASETVKPTHIVVYKDPNCGCCKSWIEHLRKHGFNVAVRDTSDVSGAKRTGRVPERLASCHTAFVNGYVVEGHVPAADIRRMLEEKPKIAGIAVPGMPAGSPGMDMGGPSDRYDVVAFTRDGRTSVFARH